MIKGPITIKLEGPSGSGKTQLLYLIQIILKTFGYNFIENEENHTMEILSKD